MNKAMPRPTPQAALRASPRINGSAAPICPTVRSQAIPPQPPKKIPAIPWVNDLPSVINAVNQLIMIQNNYALTQDQPRWVETSRVTNTVRVFNPNDKEQWVDVERISNLTFQDQATDGYFNWDY